MFFGIVLLGLLHGLLILPVYLSIFGRWSKPILSALVKEPSVQNRNEIGKEMEKPVSTIGSVTLAADHPASNTNTGKTML